MDKNIWVQELVPLLSNIRAFIGVVVESTGNTYPVLQEFQGIESDGGTDITLKEAVEIVFAAIAPILKHRGLPVKIDFEQLVTPQEFKALCDTYEIPYEEVKK